MRFLIILLCLSGTFAQATGVYQTPAEFVADTFTGRTPATKLLWVTQELQPAIRNILGHDYAALRIRYWGEPGRTAWILEEIGKERPITVGLVVAQPGLERVKVLAFRESRGWEVRHEAFTDQFQGARIDGQQQLDRHIDGITGATLSVRALTKLSRLALFLHQHSEFADAAP